MVESRELGVFSIGSHTDALSLKNFKGSRNVEDRFCACTDNGHGGAPKFNEVRRDIHTLKELLA